MSQISIDVLRQRQSLPLEAKIVMTKSKLREFYEHMHGDLYLSYSGGKDSTVLLDIVKDVYPDIPSVFCDTGLEYPEVRLLARRKADLIIRPKMSFKEVIERYGYPFPSKEQASYIWEYRHSDSEGLRNLRWNGDPSTRRYRISKRWRYLVYSDFEFSEKCCDVMKKHPFKAYEREHHRKPVLGNMASESLLRQQEYLKNGCNSFSAAREKCTPLGFWTDQDVLRYLKETGIEYPSCYGEIVEDETGLSTAGVDRTGCMFCMFGLQYDDEPNRFQRMQKDYPKQYDYCINKLKIGEVLDYVGIPYSCEKKPPKPKRRRVVWPRRIKGR